MDSFGTNLHTEAEDEYMACFFCFTFFLNSSLVTDRRADGRAGGQADRRTGERTDAPSSKDARMLARKRN